MRDGVEVSGGAVDVVGGGGQARRMKATLGSARHERSRAVSN